LTASTIVSTLASISPRTSFFGADRSWAGLITVLAYTIVFFAARQVCPTAADGRRLLAASVTAAGVASTYAVIQAANLDPIGWAHQQIGGSVTPAATMGNANFLGAFLVMSLPITLHFMQRASTDRRTFTSIVCAAVAAASCLGILLAASRGAWIACLCTLAVCAIGRRAMSRRGKRPMPVALIAATLAGLVILCVASERQGFFGALAARARDLTADSGRARLWRASLDIFLDHPMFGSGPDTFALAYQRARTLDFFVTPTKAHNEAIDILATQGLFGAVAASVFTIAIVWAARRAWRRLAPDDRPFLVAVVAGVVGFFIQSLFSFTVVGLGTLFATFAAVLSRLSEPNVSERRAMYQQPRPPWSWVRPAQGVVWMGAALLFYDAVLVPVQANRWCQRGLDDLALGRPGAVEALQSAVLLDPTRDVYWSSLGMAAQARAISAHTMDERRQHLLLARRAFEHAIRLVPIDASHHAGLGKILAALVPNGLAAPAEVFAEFDTALMIEPGNPYHHAAAGAVALALGDVSCAKQYAARGVEIWPRFGPISALLGEIALSEGRLDHGIEMLQRARTLDWYESRYEYERASRILADSLTKRRP